ncbi:MAG TPA: gephyrin-like molybdotransferase Glp [Acetobacteraceae bacterium]|nr:gephyrin-like molybdotransferase Glp [Acetobacteraceae bacterium]
MISVEEARGRILAPLRPTPPEVVPLADAWGRVSVAPCPARLTQPPYDVSAMDGYALRAADGSLGATLRVVGTAPAGHPWEGLVGGGETVRIFTGSVIPEGADGVLIQEDADPLDGGRIGVRETVTAGRHIRRAGQDFAIGDVLVPANKRIGARDIGLLASGNHAWVTVHRRPRIALLATGDEISLPGDPIPRGGIVSSNSHALAALVRARGGDPIVLPIAPDDAAAIAAAADSARGCDMLVTTGGASVGEHDLVASALAPRLTLDFWKIAMRPGKPLMSGALGDIPMLGLPGNPVSSLICAILFLVPAIDRLCGLAGTAPPTVEAVLGKPVGKNDQRADHLRAALEAGPEGVPVVTAFERQDSAMLRLLTRADALILRPPHAPALDVGARVPIIRLDTLGL